MRKPPLLATVLTLASIIILCSLGTWQVQRLHWKQGILHALAVAETMNSTPLMSYDDIAARAAGDDNMKLIRYVSLHGRWLNEKEVLVAPRTWQEKAGYHLLTPLALDGGGVILVNRGWIPAEKKKPASRPETLAATEVDVMGMLRRPERANFFVPQNVPEKNEWYRIDPAQIAAARHIEKMTPLVFYAKLETGNPELPVKEALVWHPPNNHASYAFFWFSMVGILAVVYCFRFLRKRPA